MPTRAGDEANSDKQTTPFMIDDIDGSAAQLLKREKDEQSKGNFDQR